MDSLDFFHSSNFLCICSSILFIISIYLIFEARLLVNVILLSFFSSLIGLCYLLMDAPDVAMTEAALGVCLSTCIFVRVVDRCKDKELPHKEASFKLVITTTLLLALVALLIYFGKNILPYGSSDTAFHNNINKYYLDNTKQEIGIPSFVAAMLASYRGYDTLVETTVILVAGISIAFIIGSVKSK